MTSTVRIRVEGNFSRSSGALDWIPASAGIIDRWATSRHSCESRNPGVGGMEALLRTF